MSDRWPGAAAQQAMVEAGVCAIFYRLADGTPVMCGHDAPCPIHEVNSWWERMSDDDRLSVYRSAKGWDYRLDAVQADWIDAGAPLVLRGKRYVWEPS